MSNLNTVMSQAAAASTLPDGAWDLSYAYYNDPNGWDLSTARYRTSFDVSAQEAGVRGAVFKPDGTKMYITGVGGDDVNEYDLSTAWNVSTASYVQRFSVAAQDTAPEDLFFKPDGTKMYVLGDTGNDVNEYDLSTAWDISTASYLQSFSSGIDSRPAGLSFKPDGTKMYVIGNSGDRVSEFDLSTAWDISSAVFLQFFSVATQESVPQGLFFKLDGTKMYITGATGDDVNEYDLSTAWDVSTASYVQNFSVASQETVPRSVFFDPYGGNMYVSGTTAPATIYQYTLGGFSVAAQDASPIGLSFKPDGTKMYVVGDSGDDVNEYDLSTAWDTSTASFLQNFSISPQGTNPSDLFFKPDGTKMYVTDFTADRVNEYGLSTAWDISSAVFSQWLGVGAQETLPTGIFFKPDGTKMYVVGQGGDRVWEYDLGTVWDISTSSFLQSFSVGSQDTRPQGVFFKSDGTKMYVAGDSGDDVNEYDLSTAWDVSTSSFLQSFSVNSQDIQPFGIFFRPDGTQMFVMGLYTDKVFTYSLGVQE